MFMGHELGFFKNLLFLYFWLCRECMHMRHGVPEIEINFSAIAHSDKQVSLQISTIVFSNALVETLLIKLGDNAFYVLLAEVIEKQNKLQLLAPRYFQTQQALQFAFTLSQHSWC